MKKPEVWNEDFVNFSGERAICLHILLKETLQEYKNFAKYIH